MTANGNHGHQRTDGTASILEAVNESIRELAGRASGIDAWQFVCECDDTACLELVSLTLCEYDERRAASTHLPILALHHAT
ncbi:MAG TPA: hypothetical protein VGL76_02865 [Gaiellaceae bacterium]|jgi:hypothetical protein